MAKFLTLLGGFAALLGLIVFITLNPATKISLLVSDNPHPPIVAASVDTDQDDVSGILPSALLLSTTTTLIRATVIDGSAPKQSTDAATQFEQLPLVMQREIKQLSGREIPNATATEVMPGVFLIPADAGPKVVSVAVINDDGSVSIHEY